MNLFDQIFYKGHTVLTNRAGELVTYHTSTDTISDVPAVLGSKKVNVEQDNGSIMQFKVQYFAINGNYLISQDSAEELITPSKDHWIDFNGIRYDLVNVNGTYFNSTVPSNDQAGLLTIFVIQSTKTAQ